MKIVYGVGINDADYPVSKSVNGKEVWRCPFYKTWKNMLARCYSKAYHKQYPNREGSHVDPIWHRFSDFKRWMVEQDWEGKSLDKDLLVQGNMNYGPDTAIFVSREVNAFLCERQQKSGSKGVHKYGERWQAVIRDFDSVKFKLKSKYFATKEEAEKHYEALYREAVLKLANKQTNPTIKNALINLAQ